MGLLQRAVSRRDLLTVLVQLGCGWVFVSGRHTNQLWAQGFDSAASPRGYTCQKTNAWGCSCLLVDTCHRCGCLCVGRRAVKDWPHHHVSLNPRMWMWDSWLRSCCCGFCTCLSLACTAHKGWVVRLFLPCHAARRQLGLSLWDV